MANKIQLNFEGVPDGIEPLPEGRYNVRIKDITEGNSKAGQPKVDVTYQVIAPLKYKGRLAWETLSLQPQSLWRVKSALIAYGVDSEELKGKATIDWSDLLGVECTITIKHEMYEQKLRQRTSKTELLVTVDELDAVGVQGTSLDDLLR